MITTIEVSAHLLMPYKYVSSIQRSINVRKLFIQIHLDSNLSPRHERCNSMFHKRGGDRGFTDLHECAIAARKFKRIKAYYSTVYQTQIKEVLRLSPNEYLVN